MRLSGLTLLFAVAGGQTWNEQWRPQFHQSTPVNWGNDPNGMVFDGTRYHLFYQHYPFDTVHGPMHWAHSSSTDLLTWEHHDIALVPVGIRDNDPVEITIDGETHVVPEEEWPRLGQAFSGSAILDKEGDFGHGKNAIILMWTEHTEIAQPDFRRERQSMAWLSADDDYNTVHYLDPEVHGIQNDADNNVGFFDGDQEKPAVFESDIRDPKIVKFDNNTQLSIIANCDRTVIYSAPWGTTDQWTPRSAFGVNNGKIDTLLDLSTHDPTCSHRGRTEGIWGGVQGGVWECPDLIKMTVEGTEKEVWVMIVSIGDNGGLDDGPNTGSATMYFVGRLDEDFNFLPLEEFDAYPKWVDHGPDSYAGVTYDNTSPPLFQAWMSNWLWAKEVPTRPLGWVSGMGLPRELRLINRGTTDTAPDYRLISTFVPLETIRDDELQGDFITIPGFGASASISTVGVEVTAEFTGIDLTKAGSYVTRMSANPPAEDPTAEVQDYVEVGLYIDESGEQEFRVYRSSSFEWPIEDEQTGARPGYDHYMRASISTAERISTERTTLKIHAVFDVGSIEVLFDDGEVAMSSLSFTGADLTRLSVSGTSGQGSGKYYALHSTVYEHTTTTPYPSTTSPTTTTSTSTASSTSSTTGSTTTTLAPTCPVVTCPVVTCPACEDSGVSSTIKGSLVAMMSAVGLYLMA